MPQAAAFADAYVRWEEGIGDEVDVDGTHLDVFVHHLLDGAAPLNAATDLFGRVIVESLEEGDDIIGKDALEQHQTLTFILGRMEEFVILLVERQPVAEPVAHSARTDANLYLCILNRQYLERYFLVSNM